MGKDEEDFLLLKYLFQQFQNHRFLLKHGKLYFGYTNELAKRVNEHNSGQSTFTKYGRPWKLVYYEAYVSEKDARARERQLKNMVVLLAF